MRNPKYLKYKEGVEDNDPIPEIEAIRLPHPDHNPKGVKNLTGDIFKEIIYFQPEDKQEIENIITGLQQVIHLLREQQ